MLIVDDEPDIVASLVQLIEEEIENVQAVGAYSGREALGLLADAPFSLVISDFRMPGMDGLAFLAQVHERWPDLPTALVTAYADEELARRAADDQVSLFLPKPLPLDLFVDAVQTMAKS